MKFYSQFYTGYHQSLPMGTLEKWAIIKRRKTVHNGLFSSIANHLSFTLHSAQATGSNVAWSKNLLPQTAYLRLTQTLSSQPVGSEKGQNRRESAAQTLLHDWQQITLVWIRPAANAAVDEFPQTADGAVLELNRPTHSGPPASYSVCLPERIAQSNSRANLPVENCGQVNLANSQSPLSPSVNFHN